MQARSPAERLAFMKRLRIGTAISVLHVAFDAKRGYAGEGKFDVNGLTGAGLEAVDKYLENLVFKDQVEEYIIPRIVDGFKEAGTIISPPPNLERRGSPAWCSGRRVLVVSQFALFPRISSSPTISSTVQR